jgi:hypothetical protein
MQCCSICVDDISTDKNFTILRCKHKFHAECIAGWVATQNSKIVTCPNCRTKIVEKDNTQERKIQELTNEVTHAFGQIAIYSGIAADNARTATECRGKAIFWYGEYMKKNEKVKNLEQQIRGGIPERKEEKDGKDSGEDNKEVNAPIARRIEVRRAVRKSKTPKTIEEIKEQWDENPAKCTVQQLKALAKKFNIACGHSASLKGQRIEIMQREFARLEEESDDE